MITEIITKRYEFIYEIEFVNGKAVISKTRNKIDHQVEEIDSDSQLQVGELYQLRSGQILQITNLYKNATGIVYELEDDIVESLENKERRATLQKTCDEVNQLLKSRGKAHIENKSIKLLLEIIGVKGAMTKRKLLSYKKSIRDELDYMKRRTIHLDPVFDSEEAELKLEVINTAYSLMDEIL